MQARRFQEARAVGRGDADLEGFTPAVDGERRLDPGLAQGPDAAEEAGEVADRPARHRQHHVAALQAGLFRRPARGEPHDDDLVLGLGGVEPEPGPRRARGAAEGQEIVEDRREQVDGDDHVEMQRVPGRGGLFELQRADAQQVAAGADERRAAPVRMGGRGEDRLVQHVFPITRELLARDDARRNRALPPARARHHDALADRRAS